MVTSPTSAAHIKRFDDQATRADRRPRCDTAVVKPPVS